MGTEKVKNEKRQLNKKGANLIVKFMIAILIPILVISIVSVVAIENVGKSTAENLIKHELNTAAYSMQTILDGVNYEEYTYEDGQLLKGGINITNNTDLVDDFKDTVDLDVTIFYGDTRAATSLVDTDGNRMVGTQADETIAETVLGGGTYFADNVKIDGIQYYGYYQPLKQQDSDEVIGMIFIGIKASVASSEYNKGVLKSIIFLGILILLALVAMVLFVKKIVNQINKVIGHLDEVADGSLEIDVNTKVLQRQDEIGNIARSVHTLTTSLGKIVKNILQTSHEMESFSVQFKNSFDSISDSISNVNLAVEEIANGATSQANETQTVSNNMFDMGAAIDETSGKVQTLAQSAETMKNYNDSVGETIEELVKISEETRKSVEEVHEQTNNTNRSTQEIRSATEMITDIASQTNLLSLNASIEAARAGEMGRGFAVVADEIRVLADQSKDSAEQIGSIVDSLIANSNTSVETMADLVEVIKKQDEKLNNTREVFQSLNTEITGVSLAIENISAQIESIDGNKQIAMSGVESLAAIAEENAASTEETSASMSELDKIVDECRMATGELVSMATELKSLTSKFRLGQNKNVEDIISDVTEFNEKPENEDESE